jgi:hypothetical protein
MEKRAERSEQSVREITAQAQEMTKHVADAQVAKDEP